MHYYLTGLLAVVAVCPHHLNAGCAPRLEASTLSPPSQPSVDLITRHRAIIRQTAKTYSLPATSIAGVIAAEWTLNRGLKDVVQDELLRAMLTKRSAPWWDSWQSRCQRQVVAYTPLYLKNGKWPQSLVLEGYVMSFGPAQITPRTLFEAVSHVELPQSYRFKNTRELASGLLNAEDSIIFVAIVIRHELGKISPGGIYRLENHLGQLGTLYSLGTVRLRANLATNLESIPVFRFGDWIANHREEMVKLLAYDH